MAATGIPRFAYLLPAVAMMLGWGLRGFIGGGPFGAMIPGAMVALVLCILYPRHDFAMLAAFTAIGVGFGGEMTYGQTVGFIVKADTFWWGLLGLALKGAVWGALAGAVIGLGFTPRPRLVLGGAATLAVATWTGWKFLNEPKLIYFSNPIDAPRPEIWAGFLLAAIALIVYLTWQSHPQPALCFAIAGFIGGAIGFGGGGAIQGLGRIFTPDLKLEWWKYMEFFFGLCFGWALAWAWEHSNLPAPDAGTENPTPEFEWTLSLAMAVGLFWVSWNLHARFAYLLAGAVILCVLTKYRWAARHIACSVTFAAVALDIARYWRRDHAGGSPQIVYGLAVLTSFIFAAAVVRYRDDARAQLELLMWTCVACASLKFTLQPVGLVNQVAVAFIVMAAAVSYMLRSAPVSGPEPTGASSPPLHSSL